MIKPGLHDKKYFILITGDELDELQAHAWDFTECYGLNRRIYNYKGKRPMGLYPWDVEAMKEVIGIVMEDPKNTLTKIHRNTRQYPVFTHGYMNYTSRRLTSNWNVRIQIIHP